MIGSKYNLIPWFKFNLTMNMYLVGFSLLIMIPIIASSSIEKLFPRPPVILLLGAPFSGKGTQADLLSSHLKVPILQSGDLFRKEAESGSNLGQKMDHFMKAGELIPDELTINLITKTLSSPEYESGVIMDGYPRNHDHLLIFENIIKSFDLEIDTIIFLDTSYDMLLSRVENRLVCKSCGRSISITSSNEPCCEHPELVKRADDTVEKFIKRYKVFEENTIPLVHELKLKYPEKFIHITSEMMSTLEKHQVHELIIQEMSNFPFRRIRPAIDTLSFDKPFNWLLRFVKANREITKEDLKFYLDWALECNKPDQTGLLRRVVFISTTSKPKFLEYRKTFLLYGIEVIRFPVLEDNESILKALLSEFDGPEFSSIALLSDSSNLYRPRRIPATIEALENGEYQLCSMKNGVSCTNICVLSVIYAAKNEDSTFTLKSYKLIDQINGIIKTENVKLTPFSKIFGWDNIFYIKGLDKSYQELSELGYKNSARDRVLSMFLRRHVHYKTTRNLKFNTIPVKKSVDFSIDMTKFFSGIAEYNLKLVQEYGFTNIWKQMLRSGVFFRAAAFRRIGIYWNPGVNGGLPLVKKADHIHEITFMAHDIGHQLLPDLVFTGKNSFSHKRIYIMWRMMSEAFTMALTDMIFIDALSNSGVQYDFSKRKIYPLFKALNLDVSPVTSPNRLENIRKIVHANFVYCLRGDDSEYRGLIGENEESLEALESFKAKYAPFFVEDFRWTEQNYNSMVSTRSLESLKWWSAIQDLNELLGEFKIKSIDNFLENGIDLSMNSERLLEHVFSVAFDEIITPVISSGTVVDLSLEDEEVRKFRAFTRWMIGQLSICFKYDFIPESSVLFEQMSSSIKGLNGRINDAEIEHLRGIYETYLDRLLELSVISSDDHVTYSQVYPLFDPFFVNYDKSISEYEPLASISTRILDDRNNHFSTYLRQAERVIGRVITQNEANYLNLFYLIIEKTGGKIMNGLFVVEPGVMLLTETEPVTVDTTVSILLAGISVETSLEFIAHHETKVARLTSSKTKAMCLPCFEINNYDQKMMTLIGRSLKSRSDFSVDLVNFENINLTLPGSKSTFASFTATLMDWHSILIGRLGNPPGNEAAVIKVASKICQLLHEKYPQFIKPLDYYLASKNFVKYEVRNDALPSGPVRSKILPEAWDLFDSLNIPMPPSLTSSASFVSIADFNARLTYLSFPKTKMGFSKSVNFVKNIVVKEGHASILSSFQVIHDGKTKRTKELFTELGWDHGLEPLILNEIQV